MKKVSVIERVIKPKNNCNIIEKNNRNINISSKTIKVHDKDQERLNNEGRAFACVLHNFPYGNVLIQLNKNYDIIQAWKDNTSFSLIKCTNVKNSEELNKLVRDVLKPHSLFLNNGKILEPLDGSFYQNIGIYGSEMSLREFINMSTEQKNNLLRDVSGKKRKRNRMRKRNKGNIEKEKEIL